MTFIKVKSRFVFKQALSPANHQTKPESKSNSSPYLQNIRYSLLFLAIFSTFSGLVYRLYSLNYFGIFLSLVLSFASYFIILRYFGKFNQTSYPPFHEQATLSFDNLLFPITYLIISLVCFWLLFSVRTDIALISPWEIVSPLFFIFYFLASACLFICLVLKTKYFLPLLSWHFFLSFSVALIVYKLGYGYDAFVHEATMRLISTTGSVEPKPFYYLGYYGLIVSLYKLFFIPISFLNKIIVPLLASVFIPATLYYSFGKIFSGRNSFKLSLLLLLILPFSIFILSTPQNLAYLFLLLIIIISAGRNQADEILLIFLAFATLIIHPIAGIPALIFAGINFIYNRELSINIKKTLIALGFLALCFALPLAFYISNKAQNQTSAVVTENTTQQTIAPYLAWFVPHFPTGQNFILNFVYLFNFNINWLLVLLAAFGIYLAKDRKILYLFFLCPAIALLSAYFFTSSLNFNFLISYEREDFANRIIICAVLFLVPFALLALQKICEKIFLQDKFIKVTLFVFLLILVTTSLYSSYPRRDNFKNSHGVSTNRNDINAVNWIEKNATGQDYIVLANQQVSAAALKEFGFKKYYKNDLYFYPVPTGGPLYQYYLKMVYDEPNQVNMNEAMNLAGVKLGYFVLNKYWWAFPKILEDAKTTAKNYEKFGDGDVYVFKYEFDN